MGSVRGVAEITQSRLLSEHVQVLFGHDHFRRSGRDRLALTAHMHLLNRVSEFLAGLLSLFWSGLVRSDEAVVLLHANYFVALRVESTLLCVCQIHLREQAFVIKALPVDFLLR